MKIIYQISMASGSTSGAWIDVTKEQYDDSGLYPEYVRRAVVEIEPEQIEAAMRVEHETI